MTYYGGAQLAESFRTVRDNTITIAEEIPAEQYDFRVAAGVRSVGELLAHLAVQPDWQIRVHTEGVAFIDFEMFGREMVRWATEEQALRTKDDIVAALRTGGDAFTGFLGSLDEARFGEIVTFPPVLKPPVKSRFEMLLGVKEHEMHHRGQLMLIQRMLGIVPHLTRRREAMAAASAKV